MSKLMMARPASAFPGLFREMDDVQNRLRRFLGEGFGRELMPAEPLGWIPPVEMREDATEILVTVELPGLTRDNVDLTFDDGVLTIRGEKSQEKRQEEKDKRYHVLERSYGEFQRAFSIPWAIDAAKIAAEFTDGVLKVRLPKLAKTEPNGRRIQISDTR